MGTIKTFDEFIGESVWADIYDRSTGETVRNEDEMNNWDYDKLYDYLKTNYPVFDNGKFVLQRRSNRGEDSYGIEIRYGSGGFFSDIEFYIKYFMNEYIFIDLGFDATTYHKLMRIISSSDLFKTEKAESSYDFKVMSNDGEGINNKEFDAFVDLIVNNYKN